MFGCLGSAAQYRNDSRAFDVIDRAGSWIGITTEVRFKIDLKNGGLHLTPNPHLTRNPFRSLSCWFPRIVVAALGFYSSAQLPDAARYVKIPFLSQESTDRF